MLYLYMFYILTFSENCVFPTMSLKKMDRQIKDLETLQLMISIHPENP